MLLVKLRVPLVPIVLAALRVSVLPLMTDKVAPLRVRLLTVGLILSRVPVPELMKTSSFVPGTCPQDQLLELFQLLTPPVQLHIPIAPVPLIETVADAVTGSLEVTVSVVLFRPPEDGWNFTTVVQLEPGVMVLGNELPHVPPFKV